MTQRPSVIASSTVGAEIISLSIKIEMRLPTCSLVASSQVCCASSLKVSATAGVISPVSESG